MDKLGYLLIAVGFLGGAFYIVQDKETVAWTPYFVFLVIGVVGVVIARTSALKAARSAGKLDADIETITTSLGKISAAADQLDADKDSIDVYDLRQYIEDNFGDDIQSFVEARESIGHSYSLSFYADIMSHFASGERHLNRVWSTSTDGYVDEAHTYITMAADQFREAKALFDGLKS